MFLVVLRDTLRCIDVRIVRADNVFGRSVIPRFTLLAVEPPRVVVIEANHPKRVEVSAVFR